MGEYKYFWDKSYSVNIGGSMKELDELLRSMNLNFFGKGMHKITPSCHLTSENAILLDVRSKEEFETLSLKLYHHMPVVHIPVCEIPDRINEIPKDKKIGIFCSSGTRATMVYVYLRIHGFSADNVKILEGGYAALTAELTPGKILGRIVSKDS